MLNTGNAATDLFAPEWTTGNLFEIQPVVNVLGWLAVMVISIVGFGIVIFSILKNAISGLYVVNPAFWDRVDELKADAVNGISGTINEVTGKTNNVAAKKLGGLLTWMLSIIPNIKALTDFDDSDGQAVDKKQYFLKSIPLLVVHIFIGALIFLGYPTKIATWFGNAGTYAIDAFLNNVDPVETVQRITDGIVVYDLTTDGSGSAFEQTINEATRAIHKNVITKYTDMAKQPAQSAALEIEQKLITAFDNDKIKEVLGNEEGYRITVSCITSTVTPTTSSAFTDINGDGRLFMSQASNGEITYRYWLNGTDIQTGSTMVQQNDWFVLTINATPVALTNVSSSGLIVFGGINIGSATVSGTNKATATVKIPVVGLTFGDGQTEIKGSLGRQMIIDAVDSEGVAFESFQATMSAASASQKSGISASLYFSTTDAERLKQTEGKAAYYKVNLTGSWSQDITGNNTTTTLRIQEFRLIPNGNTVSYALSTWTDVDATTLSGDSELSTAMLKKTSLAGN